MTMDGTTTTTADNESSSCVPPGFRFHPTDEELVGYYLRKKVASQKIDLDVIRDIDLYRIEPWDLQDKCRIGYEEQNEWYFFSHKDKKYPTGTRTNRATMAGFWKATGRDKAVYDNKSSTTTLIGMRKTLVFYRGRAPNGHKTDWIMHEYRLESEDNAPPQEEGWVVCRAFMKRATTSQSKSNIVGGWGSTSSTYYYDHDPTSANTSSHHPSTISSSSSAVDPNILDYVTRQAPAASSSFLAHKSLNMMCKHELEAVATAADHQNLQHLVQSDDQLPQLPQLESPSLPPPTIKRSSSLISLATDTNNRNYDDDRDQCVITGAKKVTTDWRDLDKFVASQLSHVGDNAYQGDVVIGSSFDNSYTHDTDHSDLGLLLFESTSGRDQMRNINHLSSSDCDIGICIFNK